MSTRRTSATTPELANGDAIGSKLSVSPDPNGNRAQRRAWARLAKVKAQGRIPLAEVDQDPFKADIARRTLDRLHGRDTPECRCPGDRDQHCTRPAGHEPTNLHALAGGATRWEST